VGEGQYVHESNRFLRRLLSQRGSYPIIAAAAASGQLPHFPVTLFDHVGEVYRRVETAADHDVAGIEEPRLAALVHEEPQESLPKVLRSAGVFDFAPTVMAVTGRFGRIWKVRTERDLRERRGQPATPHLDPSLRVGARRASDPRDGTSR